MNVLKFIGLGVIEAATLAAQAPCALGEIVCLIGRDTAKAVKKAAEFSEISCDKGRKKCKDGRLFLREEADLNKLLLQLKLAKPEDVVSIISEEEIEKLMEASSASLSGHDRKLKSALLKKQQQKFEQAPLTV